MKRFDLVLSAFRKIFCECGKCGHVFRLSDVEISAQTKSPNDWLSTLDSKIASLERNIEKAEENYRAKRQFVVEKERKLVEKEMYKKINSLVPNFSKVKFNTRDVKAVGFPIKFISFDGKDDGWVERVRLIDFIPEVVQQEKILESLGKAISKGNIEWKTLRITEAGSIEEE